MLLSVDSIEKTMNKEQITKQRTTERKNHLLLALVAFCLGVVIFSVCQLQSYPVTITPKIIMARCLSNIYVNHTSPFNFSTTRIKLISDPIGPAVHTKEGQTPKSTGKLKNDKEAVKSATGRAKELQHKSHLSDCPDKSPLLIGRTKVYQGNLTWDQANKNNKVSPCMSPNSSMTLGHDFPMNILRTTSYSAVQIFSSKWVFQKK